MFTDEILLCDTLLKSGRLRTQYDQQRLAKALIAIELLDISHPYAWDRNFAWVKKNG